MSTLVIAGAAFLFFIIFILPSIRVIGPTELGLVVKRFGKKLTGDNVIALKGEAGYQAELLMPGWRFKFWIVYAVQKFPWVQVPAGEIGVVIAQVGQMPLVGAKSAVYKKEFGDFTNLRVFIDQGGQKGIQRPVLRQGASLPIHPVAFLVITKNKVFGTPIDEQWINEERRGGLSCQTFGLNPDDLNVVKISPRPIGEAKEAEDTVGVVTTLEGPPLEAGNIFACRLGAFDDVEEMEKDKKTNTEIIETILADKNELHDNYQDFQAFLDNGGQMGLQHDVLRYGAYNLNPFLVKVEIVTMLVVQQGEVAVIKSYVGRPPEDTSGAEFKFGTLVKPGHRGIWEEPLRTGKYAINPRIYEAEIVPTYILNLSWAELISKAHKMDTNLKPIGAKSREGFPFTIDLQVQIHIPDTKAARVISMVGTVQNLVEEILHPAVGNYFRDTLQGMPAITFIETRQKVQEQAHAHIKEKLGIYFVEVPGTYIQDVVLPEQLITVTKDREIANQRIATLKKQQEAETQRIETENAKGIADQQAELAKSKISIDIKKNSADARQEEARGEAEYIKQTGEAEGTRIKAIGTAKAEAYQKQVEALGKNATAIVNGLTVLAENKTKVVPDILVAGGQGGASTAEALIASVLGKIMNTDKEVKPVESKKEK